MNKRVEIAGPQHDNFKKIKANASLFNKLRSTDGNGKKFAIMPFDDLVLAELLPFLLEYSNDILPRTKDINRKEISVYIPPDDDKNVITAVRLRSYLKKGARIEFGANLSQFLALFLMRMLGFQSFDNFIEFVRELRRTEINCTEDFIKLLQKHVEFTDGED